VYWPPPYINNRCHIVPSGDATTYDDSLLYSVHVTFDPTPVCLHGLDIFCPVVTIGSITNFVLSLFGSNLHNYREAIPFVFEVPTTLDALHDIIAQHASTGAHASLIIQRIHATNSVRLNHKNKNAMQNFYDVLLRRFVAVGDAIFSSGNGGPDLERYEQLNSIIKTLYVMSRDSPECAGAVWSRRMGIFQKGEP